MFYFHASEFGLCPLSGEGDGVTDVLDTGSHHDQPFKAESESTVGLCAVHSQLTVPPIGLYVKALLCDHFIELVESLLPGATSNQLADIWHQHVKGLHCATIIVLAHIECLKGPWVVIDTDRPLEDLLSKVSLMLTAHINTPFRPHIELFNLLLPEVVNEGLDCISVRNPCKRLLDDVFEPRLQLCIDPLVEELDVVSVVLHDIPQAVLDVVFGTVYDVIHFSETQLGFDHPELGQVT